MIRELHIARSFRTDAKKLGNDERLEVRAVVNRLQRDLPLAESFRDHDLRGNYAGFRECHVRPDLLLVYRKTDDGEMHILSLARISSHTNIFDVNKRRR